MFRNNDRLIHLVPFADEQARRALRELLARVTSDNPEAFKASVSRYSDLGFALDEDNEAEVRAQGAFAVLVPTSQDDQYLSVWVRPASEGGEISAFQVKGKFDLDEALGAYVPMSTLTGPLTRLREFGRKSGVFYSPRGVGTFIGLPSHSIKVQSVESERIQVAVRVSLKGKSGGPHVARLRVSRPCGELTDFQPDDVLIYWRS